MQLHSFRGLSARRQRLGSSSESVLMDCSEQRPSREPVLAVVLRVRGEDPPCDSGLGGSTESDPRLALPPGSFDTVDDLKLKLSLTELNAVSKYAQLCRIGDGS